MNPSTIVKEAKRSGEFVSKKEEVVTSFMESELRRKLEEATQAVMGDIVKGEGQHERVGLAKKILESLLNNASDETVKQLLQQLKEQVTNDDEIRLWAEELIKSTISKVHQEEPAQKKDEAAADETDNLRKKLASEILKIFKELKNEKISKIKRRKTGEDFEVSIVESAHPLLGKNVAALNSNNEYIIAKIVRYDSKENRFVAKDPFSVGQKVFQPSSIVDYLNSNYSNENIVVGQEVMALYPLGEGEMTTMFYPACVVEVEKENLKVEFKEGNEQVTVTYLQVFVPPKETSKVITNEEAKDENQVNGDENGSSDK